MLLDLWLVVVKWDLLGQQVVVVWCISLKMSSCLLRVRIRSAHHLTHRRIQTEKTTASWGIFFSWQSQEHLSPVAFKAVHERHLLPSRSFVQTGSRHVQHQWSRKYTLMQCKSHGRRRELRYENIIIIYNIHDPSICQLELYLYMFFQKPTYLWFSFFSNNWFLTPHTIIYIWKISKLGGLMRNRQHPTDSKSAILKKS